MAGREDAAKGAAAGSDDATEGAGAGSDDATEGTGGDRDGAAKGAGGGREGEARDAAGTAADADAAALALTGAGLRCWSHAKRLTVATIATTAPPTSSVAAELRLGLAIAGEVG